MLRRYTIHKAHAKVSTCARRLHIRADGQVRDGEVDECHSRSLPPYERRVIAWIKSVSFDERSNVYSSVRACRSFTKEKICLLFALIAASSYLQVGRSWLKPVKQLQSPMTHMKIVGAGSYR